jgi:hypothetical protein
VAAAPVCSKCGNPRTIVVGTSPSPLATIVRCDACGHTSFIPIDAAAPLAPVEPRRCGKCNSVRIRQVGQSSAVSPVVYFRCDACEHLSVVRHDRV